jgi:MbtH protein
VADSHERERAAGSKADELRPSDQPDQTVYAVVVNDEEQYSIWPATYELPAGWRRTGMEGTESECGAYVEEEWIDMRPLSIRTSTEGGAEARS